MNVSSIVGLVTVNQICCRFYLFHLFLDGRLGQGQTFFDMEASF